MLGVFSLCYSTKAIFIVTIYVFPYDTMYEEVFVICGLSVSRSIHLLGSELTRYQIKI